MGHCYHHALSSVRKWGGVAEDYLPLHQWFDESKALPADFRHRSGAAYRRAACDRGSRFYPELRRLGALHSPEPWMGRAQPIHKLFDPFAVSGETAAEIRPPQHP